MFHPSSKFYRLILIFTVGLMGIPPFCAAEEIAHTVKEGETFYAISRRYGVSADTLMRVNKIEDPARLRPGTRLVIPDMYEVKKGDTLYGIARRYGCDVSVLLTLNNITIDGILKPGDLLSIPKSVSAPGSAASGPPSPNSPGRDSPGITPVIQEGDANTFWPHPGAKKTLGGKLEGLAFEGKPGDTVLAVASGKVVWVGPYRGFGKVVFIQSDQGYIYVYAGNEEIAVTLGDIIRRGQKIGAMGINPYENKSSLYFIVYKDGKPVRPEEAPRI
jgi:murein DD-endopeptidase MepM/ murein hydrolase activator NlpD